MANKIDKLALMAQMIDAAEKNIQSVRQILKELLGDKVPFGAADHTKKAASLSVSAGGKIIEGVFDGQNMLGPDKKQYPVPANYASKSKLVEGDVLKLTIAEDGSFIYKQIAPVERRKILGTLSQDENGQYKVVAEGKTFKVLLASLTYFKAEPGDEITIIVPKEGDVTWAAVETVIKQGSVAHGASDVGPITKKIVAEEEELEL